MEKGNDKDRKILKKRIGRTEQQQESGFVEFEAAEKINDKRKKRDKFEGKDRKMKITGKQRRE